MEVQVAEGSAGPNFLMFSMVIMIDMYIWHMAYVCVSLRKKNRIFGACTTTTTSTRAEQSRTASSRIRTASQPHANGGKKKHVRVQDRRDASSGSGSVSVSLSVTYIYIYIYWSIDSGRDMTWNSLYVLPAAPVAPTRVMECATGSCRASMNSNSHGNRTYATDTIA